MAGDTITDAAIAPSNRQLPIPRTDEFNQEIDGFLRRPGRGRRALRRTAIVFLRLLTSPPLRPFSLFARFLASLRTRPPKRPSATAWGFLRSVFFFMTPLHLATSNCHLRGKARADPRITILNALLC